MYIRAIYDIVRFTLSNEINVHSLSPLYCYWNLMIYLTLNFTAKPTSTNLTIIKWKNTKGEVKKFRLKQSIMHKWRDVGDLVVPRQQLDVWAKEKNAKECCTAVLSYWLDHPPRHYPATWEGLYELLDDSELGQVATELKQAVDSHLASLGE